MDKKTMLSRCSKTSPWIFFIAVILMAMQTDAKENRFKEEGKNLGKEIRENNLDFEKSVSLDDLTPPGLKGQVFDGKEAKNAMKNESIPTTPAMEVLNSQNTFLYQDYQLDQDSITPQ